LASELDDPFKELEESIIKDMREIYSEKVVDHFLNPRNMGEFEEADGFGKIAGHCGDTIQICLRIKDGRIADATFMTDGCGATVACCSITTELVKGSAVTEALRISPDDILNSLDGLPDSNAHCALLASNTLKKALEDYRSLQKEPWKKGYRKIEPFWGGI